MKHLLLLVALCVPSVCLAEVTLPKVVGSGMVLQREADVAIWGWADPGEQISVQPDWQTSALDTTADAEGRWSVTVQTGSVGQPHTLTVTGTNTIRLDDILFGEVWIGSGQSNMEMPLRPVSGAYTGIRNYEQEIEQADFPEIRLFQVGNLSSKEPLEDVQTGIEMYGVPLAACQWQRCSPETVPTFASTAYFFARTLNQELKVPIGIIDASWGGTSAEAWTPVPVLQQLSETSPVYASQVKQAIELPQNDRQKIPCRLYNGMIHPLRHFTIRGVVWYQGEGNTPRASRYRELFSAMITGWRKAFDADFSFYYVQLSPFNYKKVNSAFLREAQYETLTLDRTGMAVTLDIGDLTDIHPKNKQDVGRRLALWALANDYGQQIVYSGPLYQESATEDGAMRIRFDHAESGLTTSDGKPPSHFEIAGADKVFHAATAVLDGSDVIVSSASVRDPVAVRYAFTNDAQPNLMNKEGLPAGSFRTDRWQQP